MLLKLTVTAVLAGTLRGLSLGQSTHDTNLCCQQLYTSSIQDRTVFPGSIAYNNFVHSYFAVNAQLRPTCVVQPLSTEDVSVAVQVLTRSFAEPCLFAVRSGGHTTFAGASNIELGVTIDLSLMNRTIYDPDSGTATIQPGARWAGVYETLQAQGVMAPGGRTSSVGVGGFLTGGGDSLYAARVGLGCDSIERYEIVLASGEAVNVSRRSHVDLLKALKGGSCNFGIVTQFEIGVFPAEDIWGGIVVYDPSFVSRYISAAHSFVENIPADPYASWTGFFIYNSTTGQTAIFTPLAYTRPGARPDAFRDFYLIPNITDTFGFSTVLEYTRGNDFAQGLRHVVQTGTYLNRKEVMQRVFDVLTEQTRIARSAVKDKPFTLLVIVQPWVPQFWNDSEARGGNVLGLERFNKNMLNIAWDYSWEDEADDGFFEDLAESARTQLDHYAKSIGAYNEYIYLDYADGTQNPLRGYGSKNLEFLRQVARGYDPTGVFQYAAPGGFKLWRA
ncbi:hypothetical protein BJX70DRAFT_409551 [Aspergillus crustosus]